MRRVLALACAGVVACAAESPEPAAVPDAAVDSAVDSAADGGLDGAVDAVTDASGETPKPDDPPVSDRTFTEDLTTPILNPERGLMDGGGLALVDTESYVSLRGAGYTLAYAKVRLDAFRTKKLDTAFLDALDKGFGRVRDAGIKVVLSFVYNDPTTYPSTDPDASLTWIQTHLGQLAPVLGKNADVIAVMQAGLIGLWGEWHGSTNGLETKAARTAVIDAILAALPDSRRVQVRTPRYKMERFPTPVGKEVFGTTPIARIAHHNDCFLASGDDQGTYTSDADRTYLEADGAFLPMGGESCEPNPPRTDCANALAELKRFHWGYYNPLYHPTVWTTWQKGGCRDEIVRRLGYRFVVDRVQYPKVVRPGGVIPLEVDFRNVGFGTLFNDRPAKIVIDDGKQRWTVTLMGYDVFHKLGAGTGGILVVRLRLPATVAPGKAKIELALPDAAPGLAARPEYSIRLASKDLVWDAVHGTNVLAETTIDPAGPGGADPAAKDLAVLP